jgi:hypothetical protein
LARLQNYMTTQLYRITCPSPHELGEYHLGLLQPDKAEAIRQHLAECPHCAQEIAQLQAYVGELAPDLEYSLSDRIKVWVARLLEGGAERASPRTGALQPALAGLRGETSVPYIYQARDAQVVIEIQEDTEHTGYKVLLGLVTGIDTGGFQAHLWRAGSRVATTEIDELGNLALPGLEPGQYELILAGPEIEIHIQELQVGEIE